MKKRDDDHAFIVTSKDVKVCGDLKFERRGEKKEEKRLTATVGEN